MAKRLKPSPRNGVLSDLNLAACWSRTAAADVRRRDRTSAISSILDAQRALRRAEQRLVEATLRTDGARA